MSIQVHFRVFAVVFERLIRLGVQAGLELRRDGECGGPGRSTKNRDPGDGSQHLYVRCHKRAA